MQGHRLDQHVAAPISETLLEITGSAVAEIDRLDRYAEHQAGFLSRPGHVDFFGEASSTKTQSKKLSAARLKLLTPFHTVCNRYATRKLRVSRAGRQQSICAGMPAQLSFKL